MHADVFDARDDHIHARDGRQHGQRERLAKAGLSTAIEAGLVPENLQSSYKQATTRAEFAALAVTLYETLKGEITERMTFSDTDDVNVGSVK